MHKRDRRTESVARSLILGNWTPIDIENVFATSTVAHRIVSLTVCIWCCHFIRLLISNCIPTCDATYIYTHVTLADTHAHVCKINSTNKWDEEKMQSLPFGCVRTCAWAFFRSQLALFSTYIFNNESRCFKIQIVKQDTATPIETYFDERWENKNQSRRRPIFFAR